MKVEFREHLVSADTDVKAALRKIYRTADYVIGNEERSYYTAGIVGGTEFYGYGHSKEYWSKKGKLEAEAWAQFGRVFYENDPEVVSMFEEVFPYFTKSAMEALRKV